LSEMNRYGITSAFDAWVGSDDVAVYRQLDKNDKLTVKIRAALAYGYGDLFTLDSPEDYTRILKQRDVLSTKRFTLGAVKLFVDGVLEGETAALLSPYIDSEGNDGHLTYEQTSLNKIVSELVKDGIQVYTHAIGDGGVRSILDAFEAVRNDLGDSDLRHQVSHLQLIHADDHHRFAQLGVVANFQPLWAWPDEWIMGLNLPVLGMKRVERMYPIASIADSGAVVVAGSDWNVSSVNPLEAIEVALLRQDWIGNDQLASESLDHLPILNRAERVDLETMLLAYTSNGAWGMHQDETTGRLMVGMAADIVVLSEDLFTTPVQRISSVKDERTYIDGELVYSNSDD
ncbi:MAG: amidohydrolase family protein, partial [Pseudomonadota bacterium]|nr:amidohydrolase family protein [Pseudomonadota bacterium]